MCKYSGLYSGRFIGAVRDLLADLREILECVGDQQKTVRAGRTASTDWKVPMRPAVHGCALGRKKKGNEGRKNKKQPPTHTVSTARNP